MSHESSSAGLRIGDVAEATGLTVRTLHYYDEIGLAGPSARSASGHRLYQGEDVERLYLISRLRPLGLPLAEIRSALDGAGVRPLLAAHLAELGAEVQRKDRLRQRLSALLTAEPGSEITGQDVIELLEETKMVTTSPVQSVIAVLVYADIEAAYNHLVSVFQLGPGALSRDENNRAVHGELDTGRGVIWLHPQSDRFGLRSPSGGQGSTASLAVMVADVDAHFAHARAHGASIEYEPVHQPYGYREYSARDPEGGLWSFMTPL